MQPNGRALSPLSPFLNMLSKLTRGDIHQAAKALRSRVGGCTVEELASGCLRRSEEANAHMGCFAGAPWHERAAAAARASERRIRDGAHLGALDGIPITVKDNFCVAGQVTTAASKVLGEWRSPYTAAAVEALEDAGAVVTGHSNMDEFGMGSGSLFSRYGPVVNPWSPLQANGGSSSTQLSAGGSSGGAAATVASGAAFAALASDTGGSVRQPAAWCGIVGLKPTYGRVRW